MFLNLGSGDHPAAAPWVNVDSFPGAHPDLVADARSLPLEDGSVWFAYLGHVLEHLAESDVLVALAEVRRVLAPDGRLCVVGPDHDRAVGVPSPDLVLLDVIRHGGDRWPGDRHLWLSTETTAWRLVRAVFPSATPLPVASVGAPWPLVSDVWWQFAITATKESDA